MATSSAIVSGYPNLGDGTVSAPGLAFQSDSDTGIYRIGANDLGISAGGVKVAEFDSNGITADYPSWNIVDQKASNTSGGTFTSGAWRTRDLNTTIGTNTISGSSLASNQFTLPSGTYRIFASAPSYMVDRNKLKIRNITDSTDTLIGESQFCYSVYNVAGDAFVYGKFTISAQKTFELQHRCGTTNSAGNGFGVESNFGVNEIYAQVWLWKLT